MEFPVVDILLLYVVLLVSLVCHEAAHALFALLGGDRTAYRGGQVSLNPVPHIRREPFGTVILPLALLLLSKGGMTMGYASTPIDPAWAAHHPRRAALMSAAGPLANLALAALGLIALKALVLGGLAVAPYVPEFSELARSADPSQRDAGPVYAACRILSVLVTLNIILAVFNLYPLPPLDGAGVLEGLFPRQLSGVFGYLRSQPIFALLGLIVVWRTIGAVWKPVWRFAWGLVLEP
jgi:Zn-dependent protease